MIGKIVFALGIVFGYLMVSSLSLTDGMLLLIVLLLAMRYLPALPVPKSSSQIPPKTL